MSVKLLTEHHLAFLSLKEGCTCSSESTLFKMPHCWKSHVVAHMDMTIAIKSLNEMQQTVSMRLTIISHDITVIYVTLKCITI